ncbi:hypothetical protein NDU88_004898 [Pleurodeles waltl]|uniref:CCHC-type domain-containing protein n=1 Tax=Pleurodeles waltl TaxID=8319 RepID=A0AAV7W6A3_PLEWA|nr:hypothetical protein NDU88_004898 [Pleurodeles waltl]
MTYDAEGVINIRREDGRGRSGEKKEEPRTRGSRSEEIAIGASEEEKETAVTGEPTTERETAITRGPEEEKDTVEFREGDINCKSIERSAQGVKLLHKSDNHHSDVNLIHKEEEASMNQSKKYNRKNGSNPSNIKLTCYRCGSGTNLSSSKGCRTIDKICKGCGKSGHFLNVCRTSRVKKVFKVEESKSEEDSDDNEMMENVVLLVAIINKEDLQNQPKCNVHVNGESVEMLVDTRSRITILSKDTYENLECKAPLNASRIIPGAYGGHKIRLEGVFNTELMFKKKSASSNVFVVNYNVNILGWLEQQKLKMIINQCQPPYVLSIQENSLEAILEEHKKVFIGKLERLKNFKNKIEYTTCQTTCKKYTLVSPL